jgi:hypothetical protein
MKRFERRLFKFLSLPGIDLECAAGKKEDRISPVFFVLLGYA